MRIGSGHDTHRLAAGGPLRLGGLELPHDRHLVGHSDADVLLHAVTDALLGAAGFDDIGQWFPDDDPAHRGRDSAEMLAEVARRVRADGYGIVNLDCIVFAEAPRLGVAKREMARRIAAVLEIEPERVAVKAKTGEGSGAVGRGEVMAAQCVVLLENQATPAS